MTRTRLLVLDTPNLRVRKRIALPEFVSVDAISPDGRTLYVLRYPKAQAAAWSTTSWPSTSAPAGCAETRSWIRASPTSRWAASRSTRTMSPDSRWAYTLYSGEQNFVHALDTKQGTARCIDLPSGDLLAQRLTLDGPLLQVGDLATIDLRTFALTDEPVTPAATPQATATPAPATDQGGIPWVPVALGLVALAVLGLLTHRVRTHRPAPVEISVRRHLDGEREDEKATF